MPPLLEIQDLRVSFYTHSGEVQAVRGIDLSVLKGEAIAIVGESGCGKSVTAQAIMKLTPMPPGKILSGKILFNKIELSKQTSQELKKIRGKEIGMIFQDPMTSLNPTMKIGKQVMEGLIEHYGINKKQARSKAIEMLKLVLIPQAEKRIEQYPHELSGGMRQRVMIAMALACKPKLLIADEPTTALDVTVQAQILELIKKLKKEMETSIVLITHDLAIVAGMCDRIVIMYAGLIMEMGTVEQIFYNPKHPYTRALLKAIPHLKMKKDQALKAIVGSPPNLTNPPVGCPFTNRCNYAMKICNTYQPKLCKIEEKHFTACWLEHDYAKEHSR